MQDNVKVALLVVTLLAMLASWYFGIPEALQQTFLGLFLAAVGWFSPVGTVVRAFGRAVVQVFER